MPRPEPTTPQMPGNPLEKMGYPARAREELTAEDETAIYRLVTEENHDVEEVAVQMKVTPETVNQIVLERRQGSLA